MGSIEHFGYYKNIKFFIAFLQTATASICTMQICALNNAALYFIYAKPLLFYKIYLKFPFTVYFTITILRHNGRPAYERS